MSAVTSVIRIKRHINDEPQEAFVLNCKKRKTDGGDANALGETSTVLKFAGTVNQDVNISEHIAKLTKDEAKEIVTRKRPESSLKARMDQNREKSQQNRFKIVNYTRELSETAEKTPAMTIVDVEKDQTPAPVAQTSSSYSDISDEPYVYDIYISDAANSFQYPEAIDLNDLSILEYNDYLYSRPRLINSDDSDDDEGDEDSNDENNWRNDYPDEDEMSDNSIGEREMRQAMNNFEIGEDLSSDEEENGFVYSIDSEAISFEDDLDYCDVNRYGEAYARYKKRVLKDLEEDNESDDDSEEEHSCENSFHSD